MADARETRSEARLEAQTSSSVLMVRPARFGANPETAATNAFQRGGAEAPASVLARARVEFDALVAALRAHGVDVLVVEDTAEPEKPDAVFPNNWVSFHADGRVVLYPMLAPSRRREVRLDVLAQHFAGRPVLDLRAHAEREGVLEGTGSLVLDRSARVAYACLSERTSPAMLARFCRELGYRAHAFHGLDAQGFPIYHTNVMLSLGSRVAVVCLEALRAADERASLESSLGAGGREVLAISLAQMADFAGNLLELRSASGEALFVLSARARRALGPAQLARLERLGRLVSAELSTIEEHGGGSARCMIAERF